VSEPGPLVRVEVPAPHPSRPDAPAAGVALVVFERRAAFNALSFELLDELATTLERLDEDGRVRCIVLTGGGTRAFAAGADIRELAAQTPETILEGDGFAAWGRIDRIGLPIVAAIHGYALGGGCELAMACDLIVAGDDAVFGQPEIDLGIIPGAGGTQRLVRAIGKARAMELILTGRRFDAAEAERLGLVTSVVPAERTLEAAIDLAERIAAKAPLAVRAAKQAVLAAYEGSLAAGIADERRRFAALFATEDQAEGMAAFIEKRSPTWQGR
jgi:enoyl-CoA hydratase/carnithine racemase